LTEIEITISASGWLKNVPGITAEEFSNCLAKTQTRRIIQCIGLADI
jgi:hypothetical protein